MSNVTSIETPRHETTIEIEGESLTLVQGGTHQTLMGPGSGPQGPPGVAGENGSITFNRTAEIALSGQRVVRTVDGTQVNYCDAETLAHVNTLLGITTGAASGGGLITVVASGELVEVSWSWTPDQPIYCGANGALTQTYDPLWSWSRIVGFATAATKMIVDIREPLLLA